MFQAPIPGRRRLLAALLATGLATLVASSSVLAGTPVTNGYRDHAYSQSAFRPSSDKPQSKAWYTDEGGGNVNWWAGMFHSGDFKIFKLTGDKTGWSNTGVVVDPRDGTHADYLWDEGTNTLWAASVIYPNRSEPFAVPTTGDSIRIFRYSYNPANDTYTPAAGFPKIVQGTNSTATPQFRGGAWTVTIDRDSTGRLWLAWPKAGQVMYSYSNDSGVTWTDPLQLPVQAGNSINETGVLSHDDTVSVVAFGSSIGIGWSDQDGSETGLPPAEVAGNGFYFAVAAAGVADPTQAGSWSLERLPTLNQANQTQVADNHINLKATSDGRVFMVGKTGRDTTGCATGLTHPLIEVFRRTTGGTWSAHLAGTVGDCNTRPQLAISEQLETAYVFTTSPNGGGTVYVKSAPISGTGALVFRGTNTSSIQRGVPFIRSATETLIDDPSTTKQRVTSASGIAVIANNLVSAGSPNVRVYLHNFMALPASDGTPPTGTPVINGGAAGTTNPAVSVAVAAADNPGGSGVSLVRLSNSNSVDANNILNGAGSTSYIYTTPIGWTLSAGQGTKTVYVQWRDAAGNWSAPASDTIVWDTTPPTGTVQINNNDPQTNNVDVTLNLTANDGPGSGVGSVLVSNSTDFSGSTPIPFAASIPWTLSAGQGTKTVYVKFTDVAGNTSASPVTDTITLQNPDTTAPSKPGTLTHAISGSGQPGMPIRLAWGGSTDTGGSGFSHYEVQRSINSGAYVVVGTPAVGAFQTSVSTSSAVYRFRVRAVDHAGNFTGYSYTPAFRTLSYSESSSAVKYTGSWGLSSSTLYVGGKARISSRTNSTASLTFVGNRVGWLARTGPVYGSARIYINGSFVKTVSLYSTTYTNRRIVYSAAWSTSATRTIRIVVSGTAGHPKIALDQIFVTR